MMGQKASSNLGGSTIIEELKVRLREVEEQLSLADARPGPVSPPAVKAILRARRHRERMFGEDLFADPAWDIFLELYAAELASSRVGASQLCRALPVPKTTALRWIQRLEQAGWITRTRDPSHARRNFIELSKPAVRALDAYFAAILAPPTPD